MEYGLAIAALTRLYTAFRDSDWDAVEKILFVVVIGLAAGYFNFQGVTMQEGVIAGLSTSGVFTSFSYIGKKMLGVGQV